MDYFSSSPSFSPSCYSYGTALLAYFQPPSWAAFNQISLRNFYGLPWDLLFAGAKNTLLLMIAVPTLTLIACVAISWVILRSALKWRVVFDALAFLPHAVPGIIFALSAAYVALFLLRDFDPDLWNGFSSHGRLRSGAHQFRDADAEQRAGATPSGAGGSRPGNGNISLPQNGDESRPAALAGARQRLALDRSAHVSRGCTIASLLVHSGKCDSADGDLGAVAGRPFSRAAAAATIGLVFMLPLVF